jgi:hypothetical protein
MSALSTCAGRRSSSHARGSFSSSRPSRKTLPSARSCLAAPVTISLAIRCSAVRRRACAAPRTRDVFADPAVQLGRRHVAEHHIIGAAHPQARQRPPAHPSGARTRAAWTLSACTCLRGLRPRLPTHESAATRPPRTRTEADDLRLAAPVGNAYGRGLQAVVQAWLAEVRRAALRIREQLDVGARLRAA